MCQKAEKQKAALRRKWSQLTCKTKKAKHGWRGNKKKSKRETQKLDQTGPRLEAIIRVFKLGNVVI